MVISLAPIPRIFVIWFIVAWTFQSFAREDPIAINSVLDSCLPSAVSSTQRIHLFKDLVGSQWASKSKLSSLMFPTQIQSIAAYTNQPLTSSDIHQLAPKSLLCCTCPKDSSTHIDSESPRQTRQGRDDLPIYKLGSPSPPTSSQVGQDSPSRILDHAAPNMKCPCTDPWRLHQK